MKMYISMKLSILHLFQCMKQCLFGYGVQERKKRFVKFSFRMSCLYDCKFACCQLRANLLVFLVVLKRVTCYLISHLSCLKIVGDWYAQLTSSVMKSDSHLGTITCKAGNSLCASASLIEAGNPSPETMICDICCSEPSFCRDCCCILCCKTISSAYGGYSYIRCEAKADDGYICGHIAHIDCALRAYMAGTVGGSVGLDAEYCCRRCDSRTELVSHVMKLLKICGSIDSRDDVEKILNVGFCIIRGSRRTNAKQLLRHIKSAMAKV